MLGLSLLLKSFHTTGTRPPEQGYGSAVPCPRTPIDTLQELRKGVFITQFELLTQYSTEDKKKQKKKQEEEKRRG